MQGKVSIPKKIQTPAPTLIFLWLIYPPLLKMQVWFEDISSLLVN